MPWHNAAGGDAMRWIIGLFVTTILATFTAGVGFAVWEGRIGHHDGARRVIHYDSQYEMSSQRRLPADWNRALPR